MPPLFNWLDSRSAGVLLHPTCLPGGQGIGVLDREVVRFLDFLQEAGMRSWQICPLGPTGFGDSPYQCFSAFAGNPYLIDLQDLIDRGLLTSAEILPLGRLPRDRVDFGELHRIKVPLLLLAAERHRRAGEPKIGDETFAAFSARQGAWLEDYAAFREERGDGPREAHRFLQYVFFAQWGRIRAAAARRGIDIIGDVPIFVSRDSADVRSHPDLFDLDPATGRPRSVAGVPPDYFSADGQLWGNPLYRWERHAADGYAWWRDRLRAAFELCDIVRIDHFRGFDSYWAIPSGASSARTGTWLPGPGLDFFRAMRAAVPGARIIAEDLGELTPSVRRLLADTGLPGMAVLQFAFGGDAANAYLPHNLVANGVVYPGTHDNDTSLGWYGSAGEAARDHARRYLGVDGAEIGWDLIRAAYRAVSRLAIIPFQDILSLGSEARFNVPGTSEGNWRWRCRDEQFDVMLSGGTPAYLRNLGRLYGRCDCGSAQSS
jgi:4-alpha-glucanotransferase